MRFEGLLRSWIGASLTLISAVATIWLAGTGKLTLYIHPRYTVFTVTMAVIAVLVLIAAVVATAPGGSAQDAYHGRGPHDPAARIPSLRRLLTWSHGAVLVCTALALLVVPPATLSSTARQNRDLVTSGQALDSAKAVAFAGADPATFSVKDWAALLRQGGGGAVLGKPVQVSGYVLDRGEEDVFFVVRMTVSCCAVDAQPIGVPVYRPGWRSELRPSTWIALKGVFAKNPSVDSREPVAVRVSSLATIDEPAQPYVF